MVAGDTRPRRSRQTWTNKVRPRLPHLPLQLVTSWDFVTNLRMWMGRGRGLIDYLGLRAP